MIKELMKKTGWRKKRWVAIPVVLVLLAAYCGWAVRRPLPALAAVQPAIQASAPVKGATSLAWPVGGQAAVGIAGTDVLQVRGTQSGVPTASTAKLITALSVLGQKPLTPGQQGPLITINANDVALFHSYSSKDGSLVPVKLGEQISEYQALQAVLLPSANNMADSLAIWAFGSLKAYSAYANNYVAGLGLTSTHIGSDASGFDPSTVSSARDLVKLGELVMQNPVLAQIVGQSTANLPVAGAVHNVNFLLGNSGIVGIKTGNTDQAGGVFVGAAKVTVNGRPVTVVTAVMNAPDLFSAMKSSLTLIRSARTNFKPASIVKAGAVVGRYSLPWGGSVSAVATRDLSLDSWGGGSVPFSVRLQSLPAKAAAGHNTGELTVPESALYGRQSVPIKIKSAVPQPSVWWRLAHPGT
jgi:D-alanyl-D-alanine carboxypeptidase (penicillin-binding protein 5/6)